MMRHNHVKKAARLFRKELKNKISLCNVINYLKTRGYSVIFFNTSDGDKILEAYDLEQNAEVTEAFTCCSDELSAVFIDNNLHNNDKLSLVLHETGHILLNHVGTGHIEYLNKMVCEVEANAFVYDVLLHSRTYNMM